MSVLTETKILVMFSLALWFNTVASFELEDITVTFSATDFCQLVGFWEAREEIKARGSTSQEAGIARNIQSIDIVKELSKDWNIEDYKALK